MTTPSPSVPHGLTPALLAKYRPMDLEDPNLPGLVDAAVADFRDRAGWHVFPVQEDTLLLDGEGGPILTLPTLRVEEIIGVNENGRPLVDGQDYEWSAGGDLRKLQNGYLAGSWTTRFRGIRVTLNHGYPISDSIISAVASAVAMVAMNPLGIPEVMGPFQFTGAGGAWVGEAGETVGRFTLPWSA